MSRPLLPALTTPGSCARPETPLHGAVACREAEPGAWEMGSRREPEQTLKGGPSTGMVCAKALPWAGAAAELVAELLSWEQELQPSAVVNAGW